MFKRMIGALGLGALLVLGAAAAGEDSLEVKRPACVPEGVDAWMVLPTPQASIGRIKDLVEAVVPGMGMMAEMQLTEMLNGVTGGALEAGKPLVGVFTLGDEEHWAAGMAVKGADEALAALEARFGKASAMDKGLMTFVEVQDGALPDKERYASLKEDRLVMGDDKELVHMLVKAGGPLEGDLPDGVDMLGGLDVKILTARHKEEIDAFLLELEKDPVAAMDFPVVGGDAQVEAFKLIAATMGSAIAKGVEEVLLVGFEVRVNKEEISMAGGVKAVLEGELAPFIARLGAAEMPDMGLMPEKNLATIAASMPPDVTEDVIGFLGEMVGAVAAAQEGEEAKEAWEKYLKHCLAGAKQMDGKVAEAVFRRDGGLSAMAVGGVKDGDVAMDEFVKAFAILESGDLGQLADAGMKFSFKEGVRETGELKVHRMTMDMDENADDPNLAMQRQMMESIYGLPIIYEMAFGKDKFLMAFGKDAAKVLDELAAKVAAGDAGGKAMAETLARAPKGSFAIAEVDIIEYAKLVSDMMNKIMGGMMPGGGMQLEFEEGQDPPATFWITAAEDTQTLSMEYKIPVAPIKKIVDAFQKAQQKMMQQMQQGQPGFGPGGPAPMPPPGGEEF